MHYGHPDIFDRIFHFTTGGVSKASCGINLSEDIFAGIASTLFARLQRPAGHPFCETHYLSCSCSIWIMRASSEGDIHQVQLV